MKRTFLSVLCAGVLVFVSACHHDSNSPTQPVLVTPSPVPPPGSPTPTPPPSSGATRIVNVGPGMVFTDSQSGTSATTIKAGDSVQWNFMDSISHTTTSGNCCTANGLWDSGIKSSGNFTHKFATAGTFPYFCTIHGSLMTGTVTVQP
jgi:plastocyanin